MNKISEKVAYLDGLMDGLDLEDVKLKKLFTAIIDALDEIAEEISDHEDAIAEIDESLDDVYDAMEDYDEILYGEDYEEDDDDMEEEDDFFEVVCPNCGDTVCFDDAMLDSSDGLICPTCNEPIDLKIAMDEDDE